MNHISFQDWGLIEYGAAWRRQEELFREVTDIKMQNRETPGAAEPRHYLVFCEHPPVFTLGKSGKEAHLLAGPELLEAKGASVFRINRGGDITFHGPGQIVGYPILDLDLFFTDIHKYLRCLEESVIRTLASYGIGAGRLPGCTGVWLEPENPVRARKICAIGIRCSRWVTMHGFAFNVNTDLDYYNLIVPCGIRGKQVTSMERELGRKTDMEEVKERLKGKFEEVYGAKVVAGETMAKA